jgi:hypothetical protein
MALTPSQASELQDLADPTALLEIEDPIVQRKEAAPEGAVSLPAHVVLLVKPDKFTPPFTGPFRLPIARVKAEPPRRGNAQKKPGGQNPEFEMNGPWLHEGRNSVTLEEYQLMRTHPEFANSVFSGAIEIITPVPDLLEETGRTTDYGIKAALKIVAVTDDVEWLQECLRAEIDPSRAMLKKQISARIKTIQSTLQSRAGRESTMTDNG